MTIDEYIEAQLRYCEGQRKTLGDYEGAKGILSGYALAFRHMKEFLDQEKGDSIDRTATHSL